MFTQPLATVYKTKADYLLSGLTVCLLIRCFEEFSANQKIQGGLTWRHLSDSFWMGGSLRISLAELPDQGLNFVRWIDETRSILPLLL